MSSKRITIFPRTGGPVEYPNSQELTATKSSKRRFQGSDGPVGLKLPRLVTPAAKDQYRVLTPIDIDPDELFECIYTVEAAGDRPFCIAQKKPSDANENVYRIVMIRRSVEKAIYSPPERSPNILEILNTYRYDGSLFTVFDRPGCPLLDVAMVQAPQISLAELKTISREVLQGLTALSTAGFSFPSIDITDVSISDWSGQVKIGFDQATHSTSNTEEDAHAFGSMLADLINLVPDRSVFDLDHELQLFIKNADSMAFSKLRQVEFLSDAPPPKSLISLVLRAQVSVMPVEIAIGNCIKDLRVVI